MMIYFESKIDFYRAHFGIEKYPARPTLSRILNMFDGNAVGQIISQIMHKNAGNTGNVIAVDAEVIQNKAHSLLQIITAYTTESGPEKT